MFEPNLSWILPSHLYMVSEWSALCTSPFDPFSCRNALQAPNPDWQGGLGATIGAQSDNAIHYAVSGIDPNSRVSEHPPGLISAGQTYVTGLVNAIMRSPEWKSTAIFLSWDDWGGFYDHVVPPRIDLNGLGLRVPAS